MKLYSIYDKTAKIWQNPFAAPNDQHALRSFRMEVNRPHENNVLYMHPEDFGLYRSAAWDPDTGVITPEPAAELIAQGQALVQEKK